MTDEQTTWITDLRALADWLEQNPDYIPYDGFRGDIFVYSREEIAAAARRFGKAEKKSEGGYFFVRKSFGRHRIDVNAPRESVCTKVVRGVEHVAEQIIPAYDKEIVDWVCDESLLKAAV